MTIGGSSVLARRPFRRRESVAAATIADRQIRFLNVSAEMDVDFAKEKMAVFEEAWAGQRDGFYDPKYHGADWNAVHCNSRIWNEAIANGWKIVLSQTAADGGQVTITAQCGK